METAGSSCHLHSSLWDAATGRSVMAPADRESSKSGFSPVGEHFVAGQLHAARQLAWCFAPFVNSYRRYVPDSWAPTALVWGEDNRTCGFRAVGSGEGRRIESRIPGADANPYIALSAAIAAGLFGIDHGLELQPAFTGNAYEAGDLVRVPSSLAEALTELESSEVAAEALGPEVHEHLVNTARQEWRASNRVVTDWELARNFERI
jgi:glutamine synthetase